MTPRPYQTAAIAGIEESLSRVDRTLFVQPTGTGKTLTFAWLIDAWRKAGRVSSSRPAVVLAHREELLQQAMEKIAHIDPWARIGLERADKKAYYGCEIVVASVQTVGQAHSKRLNIDPSLVIVDEAHHAAGTKSYLNPLERWGAFDGRCKVVGCTATPKRLDRKALHGQKGAVFEEVAYTYSLREAVNDGWLCPLRGYRVMTKTNLDDIRTVGGDFVESDLSAAVDNAPRTSAALQRWRELASDRRTLVFCTGVGHAIHAAEAWRAAGYSTDYVSGAMSTDARSRIMQGFRSGIVQVLCNCQIATEGFDVPEIGCVVMLRPTKSWALYVQMAGRGTRISPGKDDCIILDVVDNTSKHKLCTVPSILDLPPTIDLQGRTLEEAAKKMERLGPGASAVIGAESPATLDEVDSLMEKVDLLADLDPPQEITHVSSNAWMHDGAGGYFLSVGDGRVVRLQPDILGQYSLSSPTGSVFHSKSDDLPRVIAKADKYVHSHFGDARMLFNRKAKWRKQPPTDKQAALLIQFGFDPSKFTKGRASQVISREFERRAAR